LAIAGRAASGVGSNTGTIRAAKRRHGEKPGIQPDDRDDTKSPDRLTGQHRSENECSGASTAQPAVVEAAGARIILSGRSCAAESQRIAERRERSQYCRMDHADN
jgi:hypothetical protein